MKRLALTLLSLLLAVVFTAPAYAVSTYDVTDGSNYSYSSSTSRVYTSYQPVHWGTYDQFGYNGRYYGPPHRSYYYYHRPYYRGYYYHRHYYPRPGFSFRFGF